MAMYQKHVYASILIPKEDSDKIRESIRIVLKGKRTTLTQDQKILLAKLHHRLGSLELVSHAGNPGW